MSINECHLLDTYHEHFLPVWLQKPPSWPCFLSCCPSPNIQTVLLKKYRVDHVRPALNPSTASVPIYNKIQTPSNDPRGPACSGSCHLQQPYYCTWPSPFLPRSSCTGLSVSWTDHSFYFGSSSSPFTAGLAPSIPFNLSLNVISSARRFHHFYLESVISHGIFSYLALSFVWFLNWVFLFCGIYNNSDSLHKTIF